MPNYSYVLRSYYVLQLRKLTALIQNLKQNLNKLLQPIRKYIINPRKLKHLKKKLLQEKIERNKPQSETPSTWKSHKHSDSESAGLPKGKKDTPLKNEVAHSE